MITNETILVLDTVAIPVGAGRGISQTFEIIENGDLRRTVNGELIDLTRGANRKFRSSIDCTDQSYPALVGVWRGQTLNVSFIEKFRENIAPVSLTHTLIRPYVIGSVLGRNAAGVRVTPDSVVDGLVTFPETCAMVEYLPKLDMKVVSYNVNRDEYGAETGWSLELEEV